MTQVKLFRKGVHYANVVPGLIWIVTGVPYKVRCLVLSHVAGESPTTTYGEWSWQVETVMAA